MTKAFLHGHTETIRTVQPESVQFTKTFFSEASPTYKIKGLRTVCDAHVKPTRECGKGLAQDRCASLRTLLSSPARDHERAMRRQCKPVEQRNSILSTSNCGNPALRLFGFGPIASDGFGIGYIIKEDAISMWLRLFKASQTRRFLDTIAQYLQDVQRLVMHIYRQANERTSAFVSSWGRHFAGDSCVTLPTSDCEHKLLKFALSGGLDRLLQQFPRTLAIGRASRSQIKHQPDQARILFPSARASPHYRHGFQLDFVMQLWLSR
ncbi:hypothetical protein BS47DRAFT_1402183 [Hydnum rufescens UP504]|uniref:Choline/carnitine acyltransferase domain-containing protein n=1 Tax=Hydnum rufescens UP504 TaxID=1448309 RepID=A0A9P6ADC9_9AGAM|nr:hypothetical protein BS47DRAFT_1402183 [Hydnum rufescens UP504]